MQTEGCWLIENDPPFFSNHYHHCANSDTFILTGVKPVVRFGKSRAILGNFRFYDKNGVPFDEKNDVRFKFRSGESAWESDGFSVFVGAPENTHAVVLRIRSEKPVTVKFGGVHRCPGTGWNVCPDFDGTYRDEAFNDAWLGETYTPTDGGFLVERDEVGDFLEKHSGKKWKLYVTSTFPLAVKDGMAVGKCEKEGYIGAFLCDEDQMPMSSLAEAFASAEARAERLCGRFTVSSPDKVLNAACAFVANYQDGIWFPPKHMHAETTWCTPFLGWTNRYGTAVLGWHDRLLEEAKYYAAKQVTESEKVGFPKQEDEAALSMPPTNSAFYGKGHIDEDGGIYNMQSVYMDMLIHSWRMSGDPEMLTVLRPMLELHCGWMDACFDHEKNGTYESVIDTWPTDSVWCDGGAAPEATAYAYRAHEAARDMAILCGDGESEKKHREKLDLIRKNFIPELWSKENGVPGKCREQGGCRRLNDNPWSYSVFLPIDTDILDQIQSAQALYYTKWAYQNDKTPNGRIVWHSNWVPMIWSVRPGGGLEQYMLAYAFFKAGFPEDGLELINGMLDQPAKRYSDGSHISQSGSLQSDGSRAVLEGIFGYHPDYPNGKVRFTPSMPYGWNDASVKNPDMSFSYTKSGDILTVDFAVKQKADVEIELFIYADKILSVSGGELVGLVPAFGRTKAIIHVGKCEKGHLEIAVKGDRKPVLPKEINTDPLATVFLPCEGQPVSLIDPQEVASLYEIMDNGISLKTKNLSGHKWLCALIGGKMPRYEIFHLNLSETAEEKEHFERLHPSLSEERNFEKLDMTPYFNCDITKIYEQKYLSPRPETISVRIGTDAYSPWTFRYWNNHPPKICLEKTGETLSADGVPMDVSAGEKNVAFVSLWDNFPDEITVPVNDTAKAAVLLLCGTTNPMQCGMENVRLTFTYENGQKEIIPLRNPNEFWSLCPLNANPGSNDQVLATNSDYDYASSGFCLPKIPPETVQLGENCRAVVIKWKLRPGERLASVRLSAMSKEIVIGIMSMTLVK